MRRHLVVFDDFDGPFDLQAFVESLNPGEEFLALNNQVCFVKSTLSAAEVFERFLKVKGSRRFFVSEVTAPEYAGRMDSGFWDFFDQKKPALQTAAE